MNTPNLASGQLRSFVERAERINEEIKDRNDDKKEIFAEAKANGFCVKTLKTVIKRRADPEATAEADTMLELYEAQLGTAPATHVSVHEVAA